MAVPGIASAAVGRHPPEWGTPCTWSAPESPGGDQSSPSALTDLALVMRRHRATGLGTRGVVAGRRSRVKPLLLSPLGRSCCSSPVDRGRVPQTGIDAGPGPRAQRWKYVADAPVPGPASPTAGAPSGWDPAVPPHRTLDCVSGTRTGCARTVRIHPRSRKPHSRWSDAPPQLCSSVDVRL